MTRLAYVMSTSFVVLAIAGRSSVSITPKLVWNASASAPIGLYTVRTAADLGVTDLVAVEAPEPLASFLRQREYLPAWRAADEAYRGTSRDKLCAVSDAVSALMLSRWGRRWRAIIAAESCRSGRAAGRFPRVKSSS